MLTKEFVLRKLNEIGGSKEKTIAQFNALLGAEQAFQEILNKLDEISDESENEPAESESSDI